MSNGESIVARTSRYFSESVDELKKVSSPTRQETTQATVVTIFLIMFVAIVVALLDVLFGRVMSAILS